MRGVQAGGSTKVTVEEDKAEQSVDKTDGRGNFARQSLACTMRGLNHHRITQAVRAQERVECPVCRADKLLYVRVRTLR